MDLFAEKAQAKGLELVGFVNADVPNIVQGDPGRLRQVLSKLLDNAIKFTETGEVTLMVRKVEENEETQVIKIDVTDTGTGIPSEALPRLFRSFSQADGSKYSQTRRDGARIGYLQTTGSGHGRRDRRIQSTWRRESILGFASPQESVR